MKVDQHVYHILNVSGCSADSFDEAVKATIKGAWENHRDEFSEFVSYQVTDFGGAIETKKDDLAVSYKVTLAISAVHGHDH